MYNILLSAFVCEPNRGSEEGVGWNWTVNLAKHRKVYVIVRGQEQQYIESYLREHPIDNLKFFYYEDSGLWHFIDKKIPYEFQLY
jgi:hypothetical protein